MLESRFFVQIFGSANMYVSWVLTDVHNLECIYLLTRNMLLRVAVTNKKALNSDHLRWKSRLYTTTTTTTTNKQHELIYENEELWLRVFSVSGPLEIQLSQEWMVLWVEMWCVSEWMNTCWHATLTTSGGTQ